MTTPTPPTILASSLTLPCGAILPNRLAKAAMTEGLGDPHNRATGRHERLYRLWSQGGAGLLLTGNVQIDRQHLEASGNVAVAGAQDGEQRRRLTLWAKAATMAGNHCWMQISHAGRQTPRAINPAPKAPSAVAVALPGNRFGTPVPLTGDEIEGLIERFANAAGVAQECGFTGAQIHAAHGYLLSSFLSPRANLRTDEWGGSLEGRARFLREVVRRTRARTGASFPLSVKINSADFQRGGFSADDSLQVARWLDEDGVDLIEISGGSYEQPSMMRMAGLEPVYDPTTAPASTKARESYFQKFAPAIRAEIHRAKLMVTGGFRTAAGMQAAIEQDGVDVVGLGRPLCVQANGPAGLLDGTIRKLGVWEEYLSLGPGWLGRNSPIAMMKVINGFGAQSWYYEQLQALAETGQARTRMGVLSALIKAQKRESRGVAALAR
jgi:2,4-dienoyl-CoA reductase-like NADH-dependent reductase (Old Yellow Enzyme family)